MVSEGGHVKPRRITSFGGIGSGATFGVHNADVGTLERGLLERVFFRETPDGFKPPTQPQKGIFRRRLRPFKSRLLRRMPVPTKLQLNEFPLLYKGRKRTVYERAVSSLLEVPVARKDSYLSTFVKAEKLNLTLKSNPAPRVIQPRNPRYNACVGVYLKPIEHSLYRCIDDIYDGNGPTVMKGLNCDDRGKSLFSKWSTFRNPVAIGLDASRFDQHCSKQALQWEHSIYLSLYRNEPELARLLNWQLINRGFGRCNDGSIFYVAHGSRMSGDMNTALGNVLLMCGMMYAYLSTKEIHYEFANDGDDCVLMVEEEDEHRLEDLVEWFLDMGFTMKRDESVKIFEQIQFCQSFPVTDGIHYRMLRDPRATLSKDLVTFLPCEREEQWLSARRAIAECGLSLAGDMPVVGEFYRALGRGTDSVRPNWGNSLPGMWYLALGSDHAVGEPTEESRYSFWQAFGTTPAEQIAIEHFYRSVVLEFRLGPLTVPAFTHQSALEVLVGPGTRLGC